MMSIILSLLGGGALVELLNFAFHYRSNRRQLNANALGTEVEALERTITVLKESLEAEIERHNREREQLTQRIADLNAKVESLSDELRRVRLQCLPRRLASRKIRNSQFLQPDRGC